MEKKTPCLPRCWRASVRPRERATASPSPPTDCGSTVMPSSPSLPQSCQEEKPDSMLFYTYLPKEPLSKERVEAFSDATVATLLILDICEDNVTDPTVVQKQLAAAW
ncbi:hypothetical protein ILYODFUR_014637 [Ilyodon furcidens]|uniref:Uncharacterized protein n=1 Tax=Ilyodon furcidens TaxID=33524 RepID=A0ABV0V322_9TELE